MRVTGTPSQRSSRQTSRTSSRKQEKSKKLSGLAKQNIISDIFNNRREVDDEKGEVKLRLSYTSRALFQELQEELKDFLKENREIRRQIEQIELPENSYTSQQRGSGTLYRQMGVYYRWLQIKEQSEEEKESEEEEEQNSLFLSIQKQGKDEEIKAIYQRNDEKRIDLQASRNREVPNYYYLVYPETYAFN